MVQYLIYKALLFESNQIGIKLNYQQVVAQYFNELYFPNENL
jgi:hypothetical protein